MELIQVTVVHNDANDKMPINISDIDWNSATKIIAQCKNINTLSWIKKRNILQMLHVSGNKLSDLNSLQSCIYLQSLHAYNNNISSLNGLQNCAVLQCIYIDHNNLSSLNGLQNCSALKELYVYDNNLSSLDGLQNCRALIELHASNNKLRSLDGLQNCVALQKLYVWNNNLSSIDDLQNCIDLQKLCIQNNNLSSLNVLQNCTNLRMLRMQANNLSSLDGLQNCAALQMLCADNNNLSSLDGLQNCTTLRSLSISRNTHITFLPTFLIGFRNLESFTYDGLELELDPRMRRWINRIQNYGVVDIQVYNNSQNVHDSSIQQTVRDSMRRLLAQTNMPKQCLDTLRNDIVNDYVLTEKSKSQLLQYLESEEELIELCLTYGELLWTVWQTIHNTELGHNFNLETQTEIKRVLNQELDDGDCKCFTGRMTRLVNCLNGFCPLVEVKILDAAQIGNIVLLIKQQLEMSDEGYNVDTHKQQFKKEMLDRGESIQVINEWLGHF